MEKRPRQESSDEEMKFEIGPNRYVSVSRFKGKIMIGIREYYKNSEGNLAPGKKGISLKEPEWKRLIEQVNRINEAIEEEARS